ncbi:MAG TPA: thiamine diphosphokinase [Candidatus Limnocylindrales bacterium]
MTDSRDRHLVVVAAGDVPAREALDVAWPGWDTAIAGVVAADGGLAGAEGLGLTVDVVVGDLDSADPIRLTAAQAAGTRVAAASSDKDESDTELAVLEALRLGATRVTILGALGGSRLDHALANVWLLGHEALADTPAVLLDDEVRVSLLFAPLPGGVAIERLLPGRIGATVSLLPFNGPVDGVRTRDLRYPLRGEPLEAGPARGLSNVRTGPAASVAIVGGSLLIIEAAMPPGGLSSEP